jgi:hypothetical protein
MPWHIGMAISRYSKNMGISRYRTVAEVGVQPKARSLDLLYHVVPRKRGLPSRVFKVLVQGDLV